MDNTYNDERLFEIAKKIRESLEIPEKELSDIIVPPSVAGVRFLDFKTFLKVRDGQANLRTVESSVRFKQFGNWFYANLDMYSEELEIVPEVHALLDPRTGYIIKDIERIDHIVSLCHRLTWGGSSAIGRLHTLSKSDFSRLGYYGGEMVDEYFIRTSKGDVT